MFCDLNEVIKVYLLLKQEETFRANEDKNIRVSCKQYLAKIHVLILFIAICVLNQINSNDKMKDRYQRTFNHLVLHAPYLQSLVHQGGKKAADLNSLVKEDYKADLHIIHLAGDIPGSKYDPNMISKGLFRKFLIECAQFMISSAEKWNDQDGLFNYPDYYY
ncbi:hypothetical protein HD554DRAFT_2038314 [Boletus coccyginus]|nr:hypothetical protein HD554DRAFT_2038314 [Boletus coccyginus]